MATKENAAVGSLDRGLAILDHLAAMRSATAYDLLDALGLSKSTLYRLLDRLGDQGWVRHEAATNTYRLGASALRVGGAAAASIDLRDVARPHLRRLRDLTGETASLAVPSGSEMLFLDRLRSPQPVSVVTDPGTTRPMHLSSVGRAYLAALPGPTLTERLRELVASPASPLRARDIPGIQRVLEQARLRGWSTDVRELDPSSCCCGAPVLDRTGRPIAAISVAGVAERMQGSLEEVGALVVGAALRISQELGYSPTQVFR